MPSFSPTIAFFAMLAVSFGVFPSAWLRRLGRVDPDERCRSRERSAQAGLAERGLGCAGWFRPGSHRPGLSGRRLMRAPVPAPLGRPCSEGEDQPGTGPDDARGTIARTPGTANSPLRPPGPARPPAVLGPGQRAAPADPGHRAGGVGREGPGVLGLALDVDARRQVAALQRVDGLGGWAEDVDQALVDAHFEVLPGVRGLVRG